MKKIIIVLMIVAFAGMFIVGCGKTSAPTTPSQRKTVQGKVMEVTTLPDDADLLVTNVYVNSPYDVNTGKDNSKKTIVIDLKVKNEGNMMKFYKATDFILKDKDGNVYYNDRGIKSQPFLVSNTKPGATVQGRIGFTVPKTETGFTLIYKGATGDIVIDLSKEKQK